MKTRKLDPHLRIKSALSPRDNWSTERVINLPMVTQFRNVRARISSKAPGPRVQTLKLSALNPDCHITLGKSFNLSGPEFSIHKMQIIILITTGSFGSLDELIPVSANSTWHNSRCSVSVSRKHNINNMLHEWTHWPFPKWWTARSEKYRRGWQAMSSDKNSHQAAQQPLFSTTKIKNWGHCFLCSIFNLTPLSCPLVQS